MVKEKKNVRKAAPKSRAPITVEDAFALGKRAMQAVWDVSALRSMVNDISDNPLMSPGSIQGDELTRVDGTLSALSTVLETAVPSNVARTLAMVEVEAAAQRRVLVLLDLLCSFQKLVKEQDKAIKANGRPVYSDAS